MHYRETGLLSAALADERFTAEIIAEGVHVHPAAVRVLVRAKHVRAAALITYSIAAGLRGGDYQTGGLVITVELPGGTLAGSTLTTDCGITTLVVWGAAFLEEALAMGRSNPASAIGLHDYKGQIAAGFDAYLICLDVALNVQ